MTLSRAINIISFDVPFPPNYGGIIDVYYKLVWLKKMNVKVHLHCFSYGRGPSEDLENICEKVHYYRRKTGFSSNLSSLPYTVVSRRSKELEKNLLSNDYPILFEVLHTCYLLNDERFKNRIKIYRHSNIEHIYYRHLAHAEKSFLKKIYLNTEARKLEKFEKIVANADHILAVNESDADYFRRKYPSTKTTYLPSFHSNDIVSVKQGKGNFILYHGNLSVSENSEAALWLINNVFTKIKSDVIIAGLNPPAFLIQKISSFKNIKLISNPSREEMNGLIANAHVHCLYTAQETGLKLKLLNVLFSGRFVICNSKMISGTGLVQNRGLIISDSFVNDIADSFQNNFDGDLIEERKSALKKFSNENNIHLLLKTVFNE